MIPVRTTSSPTLKTEKRSDKKRTLQLTLRVYRNGKVLDRFNYYIKDLGQPILLLPSQLKKSNVIDHDRGIRYTSLIEFTRKTFDEVIKKELASKSTLNRDLVKELVTNIINTDFDLEFSSELNRQLVTLDSGFNKLDGVTVDKRAIDAVSNSDIPKEPTVDPLGQVELNDIDAGDIESMIVDADERLQNETKEIRIKKIGTELRYKRGLYNKSNIFELFGSIYYREELSETYNKIVIRLFEYRHFMKPKENTQFFDEIWITNFFEFLWRDGYTNLNTKNFDPLNFNPSIFQNKKKRKYDVDNYYKLLEIVQTVSNNFINDGLLSPINFKKIDLFKICKKKKTKKGKRLKHNINHLEFTKLFFFKFKKRNLPKYQSIFSSKYYNSTVKISIKDLEIVRDLFCFQTMAGGLRGYREIQTLKFNKRDRHLSFYMKKIDYWMINPLNVYTEILVKDHDYELPTLRFNNSQKILEHIYRALVKTIGEIIPLDREIIDKGESKLIKELFNPYFARKTFSQIMLVSCRLSRDEISMFTGHSIEGGDNVLTMNYLDLEDPELKRELMDKLKLPKGYTKRTARTESK